MPLVPGLAALGARDYRVYFTGNLVSQVGAWMQSITLAWLVLQLTGSAFLLGLISTLQFGPILLLAVFTGVLADRLTKRHLLVATQAVQACLAVLLGLLVWSGRIAYWHVAALAVVWGVMNAVDQPARQAFVVELVGRERVASAVGLNSASFNAARILGPAAGGLLIARVGLSPGFLLSALALVVAIVALLRVPARPPRPRTERSGVGVEIAEGLHYALRTPVVRLVLGLQVVVSFCVFNFTVYVPLLAKNVLGQGSEGFGLLMTWLGVGAMLAGISFGAVGSRQLRPSAIAAAVATGCLLLVGLAFARRFWLAALLLSLTGFAATLVVAGCNSFLQLTAPDALRGRLMSLHALLSTGVFPIGVFCVGFVSERWGVSASLALNGLLGLAALAGLRPWVARSPAAVARA